jgi:protein-disulfide isomerase
MTFMKRRITCLVLMAAALGACHPSQPDTLDKLNERLARLEAAYARDAEALEFLNKVFAQQKQQQQAQEREEPADDAMFAVNIAESIKAGQVEGPASAPVTIVKAFDFACPFCWRAASTIDELVKDYGGKVRVVYLNMIVHEPARPAHLASCAAARQGKYNEFKHAFWDKGFEPYQQSHDPASLGEDNILEIAKGLGLDTARLKADMASPACAARIESDMQELQKFHVSGTPTFFINGKHVGGALPKEAFKEIIDEQLKIAQASGVPAVDYYNKVVLAKGEKQFRSKADPKPH